MQAKVVKFPQDAVSYTPTSPDVSTRCEVCEHFTNPASCMKVQGVISSLGWCDEFEPVTKETLVKPNFQKRTTFVKVDEAKREVWGIVTAEVPDKDNEVCDYAKSKPFYEAWVNEFKKATDGESYGNLREMHQLSAVGRAIGVEFRDGDKEIIMGFKVVDDGAWKKVVERVYTGFSHGGRIVGEMVPDPKFKGCQRYVAQPSEISLVDNPCLGVAHYTLVRADGALELVKVQGEEAGVTVSLTKLDKISADLDELKKRAVPAPAAAKGKTKRVDGEDLPAAAFVYVGKADDPNTWVLPIQFEKDEKSKAYIRQALLKFDRVPIPTAARAAAKARLTEAAKKHAIDVDKDKKKFAAIMTLLRKRTRVTTNRVSHKQADIGHKLTFLDADLGKLAKGLFDAGRLAMLVQELAYMCMNCVSEQEWEEDDDSPLPAMLEGNVNDLLDSLIAMVAEEAQELREDVAERVHTA